MKPPTAALLWKIRCLQTLSRIGCAGYLAMGILPTAFGNTCGSAIQGPARQVIETPNVRLVFAPDVWPIPIGQHFGLTLAACPKAGKPLPTRLRVDALMPAHRHGMNYRTTVQALGDGTFKAQGLMFHMPGRWRFVFEIDSEPNVERLTHETEIQ
jgi:hypothetical protein